MRIAGIWCALGRAVNVDHNQVPVPGHAGISTQLYQQAKAAEQFYYMMLFANDRDRAGNSDTWTSWSSMGLHIQVKMPPHPATRDERMLLEINLMATNYTFTNSPAGIAKIPRASRRC